MHGFGGMGMGLGMIWYWIVGILFLGLVIWFIARSLNQNSGDRPSRSSLDILKDRYARGEIDKKEFEEIKHQIE